MSLVEDKNSVNIINTSKSLSNAFSLATKINLNLFQIYNFALSKQTNNKFDFLKLSNGCEVLGITLCGYASTAVTVNLSGIPVVVGPGNFAINFSEINSGGLYFTDTNNTLYFGTLDFKDGDHCLAQVTVLLN